MNEPQIIALPGGRLHLHHGPIDIIMKAEGPNRDAAYAQAANRFQSVLAEVVRDLPNLRKPTGSHDFEGRITRRMQTACAPFAENEFVTPMAAVAGAVADDMIVSATEGLEVPKIYINNGGDIAFALSPGYSVIAQGLGGPVEITADDPARGIATSGRHGRSISMGIADAVTVIAENAGKADVAATMIANQVDLPGHPAVKRIPASEREVAEELGDRLITTEVGVLSDDEVAEALDRGEAYANECLKRGLILGASLSLRHKVRLVQ